MFFMCECDILIVVYYPACAQIESEKKILEINGKMKRLQTDIEKEVSLL
jgi:hypothetical protein